MKNVRIVPSRTISFPIPDAPPLQGWALKLTHDISGADYKKGYWMTRWTEMPTVREFAFGPSLEMVFNTEKDAKTISDLLLNEGEIETEVVKIGTP